MPYDKVPRPHNGITYCFLVMVQLRWRVALLCVLSLFLEHVGAGNSPSCGQCEKSQCRRRRQRCSERDRDRVLDACKCCKLCPIMEGETCGDYDRSMRVRCHPDLFCVPLNESTTIGVCHRECVVLTPTYDTSIVAMLPLQVDKRHLKIPAFRGLVAEDSSV